MRGLVIPEQDDDADALASLFLEKLAERRWRLAGERPGGLPDELDGVVDGPSDHVHEVVRLHDGVADVLPASAVLVRPAAGDLDGREAAVGDVGVLVEGDAATSAEREVGVGDGAGAAPVEGVVVDGPVLDGEAELRRRPHRVAAAVAVDGEPALGGGAGEDPVDGEGGDADELRAEDVVVLDVELEPGDGVGDLDAEALLPPGVLGVGDDPRLRDGGAGEADGDVGVAGDDLLGPDADAAPARVVAGAGGAAGAVAGEEAAHPLRHDVHVGEALGLGYPDVEVAVQEHGRLRGGGQVGGAFPHAAQGGMLFLFLFLFSCLARMACVTIQEGERRRRGRGHARAGRRPKPKQEEE